MGENLKDLAVAELEKLVAANDGQLEVVEEELQRRVEAAGDDGPAAAQALERIEAAKTEKDAAGAQAGAGEPTEARAQGEQTWMVQRRFDEGATVLPEWAEEIWVDVALVTVPPRTKRRTIVEKALEQKPAAAPDKKSDDPTFFRVLDTDSGEAIKVAWEIPPSPEPVLRIG